ncbi:TolC family protein [Stutzerimonas tarimensis]|uniref:TolC family protein n=1 Tax=Stutzerimonas tarimensis TaxID=1507735 RepID=A0ABV7T7J1_9GAMM
MRKPCAPMALLGCVLGTVTLFTAASPQQNPLETAAPHLSGQPIASIAGTTDILTLAVAMQRAIEASPELASARRALFANDALITQARVFPNPVLSATRDEIGSDAPITELVLSQEIELGGKRSARIAAAQTARGAASADLDAARAQLLSTVTASFFAVLVAQERLELAQATSSLAQRALNAATKRVAAGKVPFIEQTRAQVAAAGVQMELSDAETALDIARQRLSVLWNDPEPRFGRVVHATDSLPNPPALAELYSHLAQSPLIQRARLETERYEALLAMERAERIPNLTVSAGAQRSDAFDSTQAVVGVAIELPLFDRNQGNISAAEQRLYQARDQYSGLAIQLKRDLAQAHAQLTSANRQARTLREQVLPGAESAFSAATKGFELGRFDFLDVLDAQRTLLQARTQYLNTLVQASQASAELERILGSLVAPSATTPETEEINN